MRKFPKYTTCYVAEDGKEFFNEKECQYYEEHILGKLKLLKFFRVAYLPDLTETGRFMRTAYFAVNVPEKYGCIHREVLDTYLLKELKLYPLQESVMGYGIQRSYSVDNLALCYFLGHSAGGHTDTTNPYTLISPTYIEGFDPNLWFNYADKWKFRI